MNAEIIQHQIRDESDRDIAKNITKRLNASPKPHQKASVVIGENMSRLPIGA
jgi:hypothetical protein